MKLGLVLFSIALATLDALEHETEFVAAHSERFITHRSIGAKGRLGNQMFQFAIMFTLSKKYNLSMIIEKKQSLHHHQMLFFSFPNIKIEIRDDLPRITRNFTEFDATTVHPELFQIAAEHVDGGLAIDGYFQNQEYLDPGLEPDIRKAFEFSEYVEIACQVRIEALKEKCEDKSQCVLVSLHIRRGDNVRPVNGAPIQNSPPIGYIQRAIGHFRNQFSSNILFVVFTDEDRDMVWCKRNLPDDEDIVFMERMDSTCDFCVMSRCDHNIMSPSTFSWWAAYLNPNKDKQVIVPNPWWNVEHLVTGKLRQDCVANPNWISMDLFRPGFLNSSGEDVRPNEDSTIDWGIEIETPEDFQQVTALPFVLKYYVWAGPRITTLLLNGRQVMKPKTDAAVGITIPWMPNGVYDVEVQRLYEDGTNYNMSAVVKSVHINVPDNQRPKELSDALVETSGHSG